MSHDPAAVPAVDLALAEDILLELLAVDGPSGREGEVARHISERLVRDGGLDARWIGCDTAASRLTGYEVGNLVVRVPGTRSGPARLFSAHMDAVPLCRGAVPVRSGERIVPAGPTALGGDDRTGCAALVAMLCALRGVDHPPVRALFTVGEEAGLLGAREADPSVFDGVDMGFNVDGGEAARFVVGTIGMQLWRAEVRGIASHAGVFPQRGVSAAAIGALAIAQVIERGWFGRVERPEGRGTSNVGRVEGGQATNEVMPGLLVVGESRSHDPTFLDRITAAYREAFDAAIERLPNAAGDRARLSFEVRDALPGYRLDPDGPTARHACRAARAIGLSPSLEVCDGGLDASYLSRYVPTITFGAGQHDPHSTGEFVDLGEFRDGCRLALALATL